ncbi:nicotinate phosphoribosyltransferase [Leptotrichia trevisanii]|uniref:Nicotinate phosphoribosyltransferase n=1 Tax=Leptotrichia trevisanii TaxID=109328 RepID=A0A510KPR0_9FUSO|nr:nicotinate phosphoribosyltransferase [Leptotrichia trevisanii]BBM53718.1 nicotinate phosphoribosyltransferase [Leptotrichia trevisanii]
MEKFFKFLNSDRYQYTESEIYLKNNMQNEIATFDVFLRTKKENDYAVVYGISDVLELIEILNETSCKDKKKYLSKIFDNTDFIEYIANMKFTGTIKGVRDGEIVFSNEPILTITAPLIQGKILETPILNILHFQTLAATVTSKIVLAAEGRGVLSFGTRRTAGFEAAMTMTKASYVAGCISHSNLAAEYFYDLKSTGTMTHGFIQTFGMGKNAEYKAFDAFIKMYRNKNQALIILIDTYNTLESGIMSAVRAFKDNGINDEYEGMYGIRIDSGDLEKLSKECRRILDKNGLYKAKIVLTSGLDEKKIRTLIKNNAKVDIFGVGDAIALPERAISTVYKMAKINENNVMKISDESGKTSLPGNKDLYRVYENNDFYDIIALEDEKLEDTGNVKKLTIDYISDGEKIVENYEFLDLKKSKEYYDSNLMFVRKVYGEKLKLARVKLSEKLEYLKTELLKARKNM